MLEEVGRALDAAGLVGEAREHAHERDEYEPRAQHEAPQAHTLWAPEVGDAPGHQSNGHDEGARAKDQAQDAGDARSDKGVLRQDHHDEQENAQQHQAYADEVVAQSRAEDRGARFVALVFSF